MARAPKHLRKYRCSRTGQRYSASQMTYEPGTGYLVARHQSDGMYNEVDHPRNFPRAPIGPEAQPGYFREQTEGPRLVAATVLGDFDGNVMLLGNLQVRLD